ncbi:putative ser thr protein phosphatase [Diaporthe ampelina]|uniref:Putative ser thr protein phosphatase n=1 Tax=Diaporthe ampelina TaxID=1214573 RepID=A0A0G2IFX5_9PEZI|nr:putative ser thr protein phosphatase [Diaporthe ampelina]
MPKTLHIKSDYLDMELQILSDLHLESPEAYDFYEIKPSALHLALLGDIGCVSDPGYLTFLTAQLAQFRVVFHLLENHEPYDSTWDATIKKLREFQEQNPQE